MAGPPPQRPHEPVPGNPYVDPVPAPRRRGSATAWIAAGAVLAAVGAGAGAYALLKEDGGKGSGGFRAPLARDRGPSGEPSGSGERTDAPGGSGPPVRRIDVNAGAKPGESRGWLDLNGVRLPGKGAMLGDLWTVGGRSDALVVQALYDTVTAYRARDGEKAWTLRLPDKVCDTPVDTAPGGHVVVAYGDGSTSGTGKCNQLQQIDLRTGERGWHRELKEHDLSDSTSSVRLAVTGATVTVAQGDLAHTYRVSDGKRLFSSQRDRVGTCYLRDVAGGARLLYVENCAAGAPKAHGRVRNVDPRTGDVRWQYRSRDGWTVDKVYSVDPLVLAVRSRDDPDEWGIVSVDGKGRERAWIPLHRGPYAFEMCDGAGDAGEGVQNCPGGAVVGDVLHLPTAPKGGLGPNKVVAFDLATGKRRWAAAVPGGRQLTPVRQAGGGKGSGVVVYVRAQAGKPGRTVRFPASGGAPRVLLRHSTPAQKWEAEMFAGETLYSGGRVFVAPSRLAPKSLGGNKEQGRLLSFGGDLETP
ncbi:Outer membrane protein assembly factor BamB [Streptomyces sp. YIM 121038]|uniref:outer membrane protein assembly factor BamB family protein n=1 Tax=Streptomyces sp. YIM 121038 TaxID=2136401 RepID=UPI0011100B27|nr:PQQ-binding-like beta-propeller repeat protein [Streptomyces sp. YIM 121038]QCX78041.1 Outer membrane protein assembly factor BamB [Streptomyces sp. YIM 121038]